MTASSTSAAVVKTANSPRRGRGTRDDALDSSSSSQREKAHWAGEGGISTKKYVHLFVVNFNDRKTFGAKFRGALCT